MDKMKRYIWAFPGTGKSSTKLPFTFVDADSERFKFLFPEGSDTALHRQEQWAGVSPNPEYPSNYFRYLDSLDADVVFINCHLRFLEEMDKQNVIVVYPSEKLKDVFLRRYADRGDSDSFVEFMADSFEAMVGFIRQSPFRKYEITEPDLYLSYILIGGNLMSQFITKKELTDLFYEARSLGVYSPPEPYGTLYPAEELAQKCFEGAFEVDIVQVKEALAAKKQEIKQEQEITARRGGLSHDELRDKILQGIVNGALQIHHGQIAPYSYGFEVGLRNEANKAVHRWECYCSFPDVAEEVTRRIEKGELDREVFSSNAALRPVDVPSLLSIIDEKERTAITSFVEASISGLEPRGRYRGHVANCNDVHNGRALDGIILGHFQGDYSSITTGSQNDMVRALVAMKGFCLDCIDYLPSAPLRTFVVDYLKSRGTDISTQEKLQAWIQANPDKCGRQENRARKKSLNGQIHTAAARAEKANTNVGREVIPDKNR